MKTFHDFTTGKVYCNSFENWNIKKKRYGKIMSYKTTFVQNLIDEIDVK